MNKQRVVITGMGVVSPNAIGVDQFELALRNGESGITHHEESKELNLRCQLGGRPPLTKEEIEKHLPPFHVEKIKNNGILYGCMAGVEACKMAGIPINLTLSLCIVRAAIRQITR